MNAYKNSIKSRRLCHLRPPELPTIGTSGGCVHWHLFAYGTLEIPAVMRAVVGIQRAQTGNPEALVPGEPLSPQPHPS